MFYKTQGIVLHTIKFGDTSIISHIYTRDFGRQSYLINGVRNKKSKFHFNNFQPLTILKIEVDHKQHREIQRLKDLKIVQPLHHIQSDIIKNTIALFTGELLYRCLHDTEANHTLFDYAASAIQILDYCDEGCVNFHLIFMVQFTRFLGIFPQNNIELDRFQPKESKIKLHELISYSLNDLSNLHISNNQRNMLINAMVDYYQYHLEGMGSISSLTVLREIFA